MLDSKKPNSPDSLVGKLLVASTTIEDPVLSRSVCLLVHQDDENVFGVLLNRPMTTHPSMQPPADELAEPGQPGNRIAKHVTQDDGGQLAKTTANEVAKTLGMIHFGGPLSGPVVAVHDNSEHAEAVAGDGVYVAAQRDLLETIVREKSGSYRLIVGHLGWTVDQLLGEHEAGHWHILDATGEDVFTGDSELWPSVIRRATSNSVARWIGIRDTPFAAEVN